MDPEERREVQDLLEFSGDSAAGRMTTEYVALPRETSLGEAIDELRTFDGDPELLTEIYLLDTDRRLCAVIPLVHILLAQPGAALQSLPRSHLVSCKADASGRKVAELFDKYNLRSLPVVDESGKLVGVVHAEQVIALLRNKSS
jgi:Mg/Co/Ni transporter MgtE